jgi:hypothetical protein
VVHVGIRNESGFKTQIPQSNRQIRILARMNISKPFEASNAFRDNPILKLLGWNLSIFWTTANSASSQERSHCKIDRFFEYLKNCLELSGPPKQSSFYLKLHQLLINTLLNNTIWIKDDKIVTSGFSFHNFENLQVLNFP